MKDLKWVYLRKFLLLLLKNVLVYFPWTAVEIISGSRGHMWLVWIFLFWFGLVHLFLEHSFYKVTGIVKVVYANEILEILCASFIPQEDTTSKSNSVCSDLEATKPGRQASYKRLFSDLKQPRRIKRVFGKHYTKGKVLFHYFLILRIQ